MRPSDTFIPLSTRALFLSTLVTWAASGCAPPAQPLLAAAPSAQAAPPSDPAPLSDFEPARYRAFSDARPAPIEPALDGRASVACHWLASGWWAGLLRITAQTRAFASAFGGRAAQVTIPEGDAAPGASVSVELPGLRLKAIAAATELALYLKAPRLFQGYLWSRAQTELSWTRASRGRVAYELRLPQRVAPASGTPHGEEACAKLSLDAASNDDELSLALRGGRQFVWQGRWRGAEHVPLSRAPGQPAVAFLDTRAECLSEEPGCNDAEPDEVIVFETRAHFVRIAYVLETAVVVGWVPESALQEPLERFDADALVLSSPPWNEPLEPFGASDPTRLSNRDEKPSCAWNAPLAVEFSGAMRAVGTVASAIPLFLRSRRDGWREVELEHPALSLTKGARLWVPERSLYPCEARQ